MIHLKPACVEKIQRISQKDLPLSCPMPGQILWSAHPRVYLAIEDSPKGEIQCPYCSTYYVLEEI